jgi:hypothetical protein
MKSNNNCIIATAVVAAVLTVGATAQSSLIDGNSLFRSCQENDSRAHWGACLGYVRGITDILLAGHQMNGVTACVPRDVETGQVTDVVKQFLARHPDQRHLPAEGLVGAALQEAFPCR